VFSSVLILQGLSFNFFFVLILPGLKFLKGFSKQPHSIVGSALSLLLVCRCILFIFFFFPALSLLLVCRDMLFIFFIVVFIFFMVYNTII